MDKISVVITCYKAGEPLHQAMKSLEKQTNRSFEIIIVNDASRDKRLNEACKFYEHKRLAKVIWNKTNLGTSAARNTGCKAMTGNIYVPLDADDELLPDSIEVIYKTFAETPSADFVFGNYLRKELNSEGSVTVNTECLCDDEGFLDPKKLAKDFILYGGSPFRRSLWLTIGGYDESVESGFEDVDFWLRALLCSPKGKYVDQTIYFWKRTNEEMHRKVSNVYKHYIVHIKNKSYQNAYGKVSKINQIKNNVLARLPRSIVLRWLEFRMLTKER